MDALARHYVRQGDTRGQDSHPHFAVLRLGAFFFHYSKCIRSTVVSDDYASVSHGPLPPVAGARTLCGPVLYIAVKSSGVHVLARSIRLEDHRGRDTHLPCKAVISSWLKREFLACYVFNRT